MRLKLESIKGVREVGEEKLWDIIESIYQETNPTYIRRVKAIEMVMEKGELCGYYFTRLKLEYQEAQMERATTWSLFVCQLISSLSSAGSNNRDLKSKLLFTYRDNPDPDERGKCVCCKPCGHATSKPMLVSQQCLILLLSSSELTMGVLFRISITLFN